VLGSVPAAGVLALSSATAREKTDQERGPVVHTVDSGIGKEWCDGISLRTDWKFTNQIGAPTILS
jgi:hypothetical protein